MGPLYVLVKDTGCYITSSCKRTRYKCLSVQNSYLVEKQVALPYHARNMCTLWNAYFHTITTFFCVNDTLKKYDPEYYVTSLICIFTYTFIHMPEFGKFDLANQVLRIFMNSQNSRYAMLFFL